MVSEFIFRSGLDTNEHVLATFINSELILISTDVMAHYWKEMGHVSYFRRVDIDALLKT